MKNMRPLFSHYADHSALVSSHPLAFIFAFLFVIVWLALGTVFHYSHFWEMVMSIIPATVTFLLVFLIQNSQYKETRAIQLKLDEIILATKGAENAMLHLEKLSTEEMKDLSKKYEDIATEARAQIDDIDDDHPLARVAQDDLADPKKP